MKCRRIILLVLITVLLVGCRNENKMLDENETKRKTDVVEKIDSVNMNEEETTMDKRKCIVGEIVSIEDEYIYMKGAEDIYYRVYIKQKESFTEGNFLYVFYSEKEQIEEGEYKLIAEKVEEEDPKKQRRK